MKKLYKVFVALFVFAFLNIGNVVFGEISIDSIYQNLSQVASDLVPHGEVDQFILDSVTVDSIKRIKNGNESISEEEASALLILIQDRARENIKKIKESANTKKETEVATETETKAETKAKEKTAEEKEAESARKASIAETAEKIDDESERIRRALNDMTKESSYFSVTGYKPVYERDANGELQRTGMVFDDRLGLRASRHSKEAELSLSGDNSNNNLLTRVISLMVKLLGTLVILLLVVGGFFMITSQGDENQLQKGKTILTYALIGAVVAFTSYIIVQFVINIIFLNS